MDKVNNHIEQTAPAPNRGRGHWVALALLKAKFFELIYFGKNHPRAFVVQSITYLLLILWIVVGSRKVFDYTAFRQAMLDQPFEDNYGVVLSYLLPLMQLGTGMLLIFEKTRRYGFLLTILLMMAFSWYIALVLKRRWGFIPCDCTLEFPVDWKGHLWINGIIAVSALTGLLLESIRIRANNYVT
ncbi:MauE/DoxX family redox-associated membrane protein [Sphingobacterium sp. UBA1498]|uniref:MauE/DoxX family redox-associated membrane protein n=1 Tax=Sphingobacterium sp. UBA1498 TaxID=1947481 RepID=UPI0025DF8ACD|nr:MauE/DoxX family redox-associated membrane protein [Sphingobacterium sp. UBA1498]